jgi:sialate O-acetylesterase
MSIKIAGMFSNNMVLQQGKPVPVWGTSDPENRIVVRFMGIDYVAVAAKDGRWQVTIPPMTANFIPETMEISNSEERVTFENILIGEVWLCSGQSNMEFSLHEDEESHAVIESADCPHIRLYMVPRRAAGFPQDDIGRSRHIFDGHWEVCQPVVAQFFSAVGYYFGLELFKKLNVPIGLINASIGCTGIETWTSSDAFDNNPLLHEHSLAINNAHEEYKRELSSCLPAIEQWISTAANHNLFAHIPEHPLAHWRKETGMYNGMIAPLAPYAFCGVIWYQGESNCHDGIGYAEKMKALVSGWRNKWGGDFFPFYQVQIAPCDDYGTEACPGELPELWLGQYKASEEIKNCSMVSTIDLGDIQNIHVKRKYPVGYRLAMLALAEAYGHEGLEYKSPSFQNLMLESDKIRIYFKDVGKGGLCSKDGKPLSWFDIEGRNREYSRANAIIEGSTVVIWAPNVKSPKVVRFAWNKLATPNLSGKNGLPVLPFIAECLNN